jgi:hypothetical protein
LVVSTLGFATVSAFFRDNLTAAQGEWMPSHI